MYKLLISLAALLIFTQAVQLEAEVATEFWQDFDWDAIMWQPEELVPKRSSRVKKQAVDKEISTKSNDADKDDEDIGEAHIEELGLEVNTLIAAVDADVKAE